MPEGNYVQTDAIKQAVTGQELAILAAPQARMTQEALIETGPRPADSASNLQPSPS